MQASGFSQVPRKLLPKNSDKETFQTAPTHFHVYVAHWKINAVQLCE